MTGRLIHGQAMGMTNTNYTNTHPATTVAAYAREEEAGRYVVAAIENAERGLVLSMDDAGTQLRIVDARTGYTTSLRSLRPGGDIMDMQADAFATMIRDIPDATHGEVWSIGYALFVHPTDDRFEVTRGGGMVNPDKRHVVGARTFRDGWNVAAAIVVAEVRNEAS